MAESNDLDKIIRRLHLGDWFLVYQLGCNMEPMIFAEFIKEFSKELEKSLETIDRKPMLYQGWLRTPMLKILNTDSHVIRGYWRLGNLTWWPYPRIIQITFYLDSLTPNILKKWYHLLFSLFCIWIFGSKIIFTSIFLLLIFLVNPYYHCRWYVCKTIITILYELINEFIVLFQK